MKALRTYLWIDPMIILTTVVLGSVSVVMMAFDKSGNTAHRVGRLWAKLLVKIAGLRVKVIGLEKLDPQQSYVFCANHLSYMDTPVLFSNIRWNFRFLAKKELFEIPFMGTHLKQAGHVSVPLEDPRASLKTLSLAAEAIQQKSISLLIFPEGGRSENGQLQPFLEGAAYLATKAQVPIAPMALIGTREVLPMHGNIFSPGPVTLRVGVPIVTKGRTTRDREHITAEIRSQIEALLGQGH